MSKQGPQQGSKQKKEAGRHDINPEPFSAPGENTALFGGEDQNSSQSLSALESRKGLQKHRIENVQTILVVLSSFAMALDMESLRRLILNSYPDAAVFFRATSGKPIGVPAPSQVDLLIDFTGPRQKQGWFYAKKLRKQAKFAVGRNAGLFRKKIYDRLFDEKTRDRELPSGRLDREYEVQKAVLALIGVAVSPTAQTTPNVDKQIALELPALQRES